MVRAPQPSLPPGVLYRHDLWFAVWVLVVVELSVTLSASPLWAAGIGGKIVVSVLCLGFLLLWLQLILWRERHGWWVFRPANPPDLSARFGGVGWSASFDVQGVRAQSSIGHNARAVAYTNIKFVDASAKGKGSREIYVVEQGATPLTLNLNDDELMAVLALLTRSAPQAQFRGALEPMSRGWRPRDWTDWS